MSFRVLHIWLVQGGILIIIPKYISTVYQINNYIIEYQYNKIFFLRNTGNDEPLKCFRSFVPEWKMTS